MCCIYDINIERGTTVCGPPVNIIAPSDLRYASRINDRYERRIFFVLYFHLGNEEKSSARCKRVTLKIWIVQIFQEKIIILIT